LFIKFSPRKPIHRLWREWERSYGTCKSYTNFQPLNSKINRFEKNKYNNIYKKITP